MSPTLAKRLREVLTEALPDDLETAMEQLKAVRDQLRGDFEYKVQELNRITEVLVAKKEEREERGKEEMVGPGGAASQ